MSRHWTPPADYVKPDHKASVPSPAELMERAFTEPGKLSESFSMFWSYSFGNRMLAAEQCAARGIPLGPIATFPAWLAKGRKVRKGEKAIVLCQPVTATRKPDPDADADADPKSGTFTLFLYRAAWFTLAQTDGPELPPDNPPGWQEDKALAALGVTLVPFDHADGNVGGYATRKRIALNPLHADRFAIMCHELAHILLGHTDMSDSTARGDREVDAELVAYLVCATLGRDGAEQRRGYIQHWRDAGRGTKPQDARARAIFRTVDQIIGAGMPARAKPGNAA